MMVGLTRCIFLCLVLSGCPPAVDDFKTVETDQFTLNYPGNWDATNTDETAFISEQLFLGQVAGATFVRIFPSDASQTLEGENLRTVETEVAGEQIVGQMSFDWNDREEFEELYCLKNHAFCVEVRSDKDHIENARPGVDLVLKSLQFN